MTFSLRFPAAVLLLFSFLSVACLLVCFGDGFDPLEVNCTSSFFFLSLFFFFFFSEITSGVWFSVSSFLPLLLLLLVFISLRVLVLP